MEKERSRLPVTRAASIPPHRPPPLFSTESRDYTFRRSGATVSANHDEKGGRPSVLARQPYRSDLPVERRVIFLFSFLLSCSLSFFLTLFQSTVKGSATERFLLNLFTFEARVALKQGERKSLTPRYAQKNMLPRENRHRGRRIRLPNHS